MPGLWRSCEPLRSGAAVPGRLQAARGLGRRPAGPVGPQHEVAGSAGAVAEGLAAGAVAAFGLALVEGIAPDRTGDPACGGAGGGAASGIALDIASGGAGTGQKGEPGLGEGFLREIPASVIDALALFETETPAFVLLDVNLAGQDSGPVAERLEAAGIPYLLASGYGQPQTSRSGAHARPAVTKPHTSQTIARALSLLRDGRGAAG